MKLYLIRHGATMGNLEKRYVSSTDEAVLPEELEQLGKRKMPQVSQVWVSPSLRCRQTAKVLYPQYEQVVVEAFRECDFGIFEYKNYRELNGNPDYQRYIDSGGETAFPGGESKGEFCARCVKAFGELVQSVKECISEDLDRCSEKGDGAVAIVAHGGTLMAILDRFSVPHRDYFEWHAANGSGFVAELTVDAAGQITLQEIKQLGEKEK